jgi:hypothetical protein
LRRCTCNGIIGVPLFSERPLFKAAKTNRVYRSVSGNARTMPTLNFNRRLTRRCSEPSDHKVLGRGRPSLPRGLLPRARVLKAQRAVAELGS